MKTGKVGRCAISSLSSIIASQPESGRCRNCIADVLMRVDCSPSLASYENTAARRRKTSIEPTVSLSTATFSGDPPPDRRRSYKTPPCSIPSSLHPLRASYLFRNPTSSLLIWRSVLWPTFHPSRRRLFSCIFTRRLAASSTGFAMNCTHEMGNGKKSNDTGSAMKMVMYIALNICSNTIEMKIICYVLRSLL